MASDPKDAAAAAPGRGPGGRGAGLTRDVIATAALALMDAEGVDAFSVRALARHLGVESSALYWHFKGKEEICRYIVEIVGAGMTTAEPTAGTSPRLLLARHLADIRSYWREHPSALRLTRSFPPSANDISRAGRTLLEGMGIPAEDTLERYRALIWVVMGFVQMEQNVSASANHRLIEGSQHRYEILTDHDELRSAPLDTDRLFGDIIELLLDALAARAAGGVAQQ